METERNVFAQNVATMRQERRHTVRSLAEVLSKLGRPIHPSGISKIESGDRKPGPDDVVALALALNVTPNRLLLPVDGSEVALTPEVTTNQAQAWDWADGREVILGAATLALGGDAKLMQAQEEFRRQSRPPEEQVRERHTAVRAARDVLDRVHVVLGERGGPTWDERLHLTAGDGGPQEGPTALRRALARLTAEVDDLLGDDDGER